LGVQKPKKIIFGVRLDPADLEELNLASESENRPRAWIVRGLIKQWIDGKKEKQNGR